MANSPGNRTLGWVLRIIASSFALDFAYHFAPAEAEGYRAALLDAASAMRRDSGLPERKAA